MGFIATPDADILCERSLFDKQALTTDECDIHNNATTQATAALSRPPFESGRES